MQTIGLAMLVRDEAATIAATLERVRPVISAWTVLDTGSIDDTEAVVEETLADIPGRVIHREFDGFGPCRTELLKAAAGSADYTLMLDADHTLHIDGDQPDLDADSYMIRVLDDGGRLPLLTRTAHPFEYRGVAHSYLHSDAPTTEAPLEWLAIDGGPGASVAKLQGDRVLLERAFAADPSDRRTVFYLAQTYRDLDMPELAIVYYRLRAMMGGFQEEVYWSRYQAGVLLGEHVSFSEGADELLEAWRGRPTRVEALRALARLADSVADKYPVPDDTLFLRERDYARRE